MKDNEKTSVVIVTSYYFMLNIVNLIGYGAIDAEKALFVVLSNFNNSYDLYESIKRAGYETSYFSISNKDVKCIHEFCKKQTKREILNIIVPNNRSNWLLLLVNELKHKYKSKFIIYVEDGFSIYAFDKDNFFIGSRIQRLIMSLIIPKNSTIRNPKEVWMYNPDFALKYYSFLRCIPKIDKENAELYNRVLGVKYDDSVNINKKIFFYFGTYGTKYVDKKMENHLLETIDRLDISNDFVYKRHPRLSSKDDVVLNNVDILDENSPYWEYFLMNYPNKKRILICIYSTTVYSGCYLFNECDVIVMLYKYLMLRTDNIEWNNADNFVNNMRVKGIEVYTPDSEEELLRLLERLRRNLVDKN